MRNQPLVSIVVPVYNAGKYLEKCLYSITEQEYPNLEIVVINDGSTDSSKDTIERYALKDKRFIVHNKENGGVSSARNKGIELANGKYITFIDADDVIHKSFVMKLVNDLIDNNADIATTNAQHYSMTDSEFLSTSYTTDDPIIEYSAHQALYLLYCGTLEKGHNGIQIFRSSLIKDNEITFDVTMKICEDFDFLARAISKSTKVIFDPRNMYYYRVNDASAMRTMPAMQFYESIYNKQHFGRFIESHFPEITSQLNINLLTESISCGSTMYSSRKIYPIEYEKIVNDINKFKYRSILSTRLKFKERIKVFIVVLFGTKAGLRITRIVNKIMKV